MESQSQITALSLTPLFLSALCFRYGHAVVADSGNDRVQVFSQDGDWLGTILDSEQHGILAPTDLAINGAGNLVLLQADGKVRIFTYMT